ncbi:hypothetical protein B0H16DRAFT_1466391 [Mycena metata]|uniref:Uncharacterized protein n=1 Tax=Mycena metata TaxID=1033252 RepID=A0AAD7MXP8_9AGAR|nr:hypothetical protein B0H16DRAFT_1466391 [Mycena metata]
MSALTHSARVSFSRAALHPAPPGDGTPLNGCLVYIRVTLSVDRLDDTKAYLVHNPADAPWTILQLFNLGMELEDVEECIEATLDPLGHKAATLPLFARLKAETTLADSIMPTDNFLWTYVGNSHDVQPSKRHANDLESVLVQKFPSRMGRFLYTTDLTWRCFEIVAFHLVGSLGVRSDPVASAIERFLIALQVGRGTNSAVGGFYRPSTPDNILSDIISKIITSFPSPAFGTEHTAVSEAVQQLYKDELDFVKKSGGPQMNPAAFDTSLSFASPKTYTTKTSEAPTKLRGNINEIVLHMGATADFWRVVLGTPDYWLACKLSEWLLRCIRPVPLSTWSNGVASSIILGSTRLASHGMPDSVRGALDAGRIPANIHEYLPPKHGNDYWYPQLDHDNYQPSIGQLFVAQYGPEPTSLLLFTPNIDVGAAKYRPDESYCVETIVMCVSAIERIGLALIQALHDAGVDPDWDDATNLCAYLEKLKEDVEREVTARGLCQYLDDAKMQYRTQARISRHLQKLSHPPRASPTIISRSEPYEIPGITHTSARGPARVAQLATIVDYIESLKSSGFPGAADHIIPFHLRDAVGTPEWNKWFHDLRPGIHISRSAGIWGGTEEVFLNTVRNHERFAQDTAAHSAGGKATKAKREAVLGTPSKRLLESVGGVSDLVKKPPPRRRSSPLGSLPGHANLRLGFCTACTGFPLARDNNAKHTCTDGTKTPIRDSHVDNLMRIIYPHDIINNLELTTLLPENYEEVVVPLEIDEIFKRPGNSVKVRTLFPKMNFTGLCGHVYVSPNSTDPIKDNSLHLAMALDVAVGALSLSECPQFLWPMTSTNKSKAWAGKTKDWLDQSNHVVICDWGHFEILHQMNVRENAFFAHDCLGSKAKRLIDPHTNRRVTGARKKKGGDSDCGTQQSHHILSIYDLPPDHIRCLVYNELVAKYQPELEKKSKKKKGKVETAEAESDAE